MDFGVVDGADGRIGVGVGRQQDALGVGEELHRLPQELHASHLRHPLIDQKEGHGISPALESAQTPPWPSRRSPRAAPGSAPHTGGAGRAPRLAKAMRHGDFKELACRLRRRQLEVAARRLVSA
jgi:hypothetical protein